MFTGIVESLGKITNINVSQGNVDFTVKSNISKELKIDQSVSHNGVCLTVVDVKNDTHTVTAVKETLDKSSLKNFNDSYQFLIIQNHFFHRMRHFMRKQTP